MTRHLFVYGTLRDDPKNEMYRVLERCSRFEGIGTVTARLYDLGDYPGIVLSGHPDEHVTGEVYELHESKVAEVLRILDEYEGIGPDDPQPHEYQRVLVDVCLDDSTRITAWAYVLAELVPSHPRIPVPDYLEWKKGRASA